MKSNVIIFPKTVHSSVEIGLSVDDVRKIIYKLYGEQNICVIGNNYAIQKNAKNKYMAGYKQLNFTLSPIQNNYTQIDYQFEPVARLVGILSLVFIIIIGLVYLFIFLLLAGIKMLPIIIGVAVMFSAIELAIIYAWTAKSLDKKFNKLIIKRIANLGRIIKENSIL